MKDRDTILRTRTDNIGYKRHAYNNVSCTRRFISLSDPAAQRYEEWYHPVKMCERALTDRSVMVKDDHI
jgi:hypothetical protein